MSSAVVQFDVHTPLDDGRIAEHIAHSLSLGLPEADPGPNKRLTVIANGPSAQHAPLDGDTLALNGAIRLFHNSGRSPTYWAACDPQELVCDFLPDIPPKDTIYVLASKCHPKLFARLKDRDVRLWHVNDHPIPEGLNKVHVASSVTLVALPMMRRAFGYRHFDIYGWDACYEEIAPGVIKHHASDLSMTDYPEDTVTLTIGATQHEDGSFTGGRPFRTTRTWALEGQDAMIQLTYADYGFTIHGDGMIKALYANR